MRETQSWIHPGAKVLSTGPQGGDGVRWLQGGRGRAHTGFLALAELRTQSSTEEVEKLR